MSVAWCETLVVVLPMIICGCVWVCERVYVCVKYLCVCEHERSWSCSDGMTWLIHYVARLWHMCDIHGCCFYPWWLRLVGSLKLYVSFAEYSLFYKALLWHMCDIDWCCFYPRAEWRGLTILQHYNTTTPQHSGRTTFALRNKARVFCKLTRVISYLTSSFLQDILKLGVSPEIPTQIDWHLKIENAHFVCNKFPPPILSPLHSTCGTPEEIVW